MVQAISNSTTVVLSLQESLWPRLEAVASNLSNANTVGYKALTTANHEAKSNAAGSESVSYVQSTTTFIDNRGGAIHHTGNTYDVAIQGDGYFRVAGNRYTRNGQFQVNNQGQLVTMHGDVVQGAGGSDITIPAKIKHLTIKPDGTIGGMLNKRPTVIGKLGVVTFDSYTKMKPVGYGLYTNEESPKESITGHFIQGAVEASNVEPIAELIRLTEIQRLYEQAQKAMEVDDERQRQVINVGV